MTNSKSTKRALLASVLSIVICLTMLIGSTFAWFTDSATTGVNSIQAGTLDVGLIDEAGNSLEGKALSFADKNGKTDILWEPGCTFLTQGFKVVNNGNLEFKYKVVITGLDGDSKLLEVIKFSVVGENEVEAAMTGRSYTDLQGTWQISFDSETGKNIATLVGPIASETMYVMAHMDEAAGNKYQGLTLEGIGITVYATQDTVEYDSFDNQYDDIAHVEVSSQKELIDAISKATDPSAIFMDDGTYTLPNNMSNKDITFFGTKNTTINMLSAVNASGSVLTFDGIKVVFDNDSYEGLQHSKKVTYENCALVGTQFLYAPEVVFENCTFDMYDEKTEYSVWTYGADNVSFTDCIFNTHGKAILVYNEFTNGNFVADITVDGCTFYGDGTVDKNKAAIETGSNAKNTETSNRYNITVKDTIVAGFAANKSTSPAYGNKNDMDANHLKVVLDNVKTFDKDVLLINTAEELFAFANDVNKSKNTYAGKVVMLTADIDLENKAWTPIGQTGATEFKGVFDGNGKTIRNLNVNNTDESATCSSGLFGWIESHGTEGVTVKNLTVKNAKVSGHHYVGVIVGYVYGTIENCHVENATVSCTSANDDANGDKAGLIAGYVGEGSTVNGCTGADSAVSAGRDAGQIVGASRAASVTNCSATNVTVTANGTSTGNNIKADIIGRVL